MIAGATPARTGLVAAVIAVACSGCAPAGALKTACFTARDNQRLAFMVVQQAPPPRAGQADYAYYPMTAATTMRVSALTPAASPAATPALYYYHWANRGSGALVGLSGQAVVRKLNLQPSLGGNRHQRSAFSTIAKADACTLAQAAALLGKREDAVGYARDNGITLAEETALPDTGEAAPADTCVLAGGTLGAATKGMVLDYEVQDGRDGPGTTQFLQRYAALIHGAGKQVILLVNPLDSPGERRFTGITEANANTIVAQFDQTALLLWSKSASGSVAASYAAQRAIVAAGGAVDPARLLINFELAGTTPDDAKYVGATIRRDHLAGVMFWRNHAAQGGDCATPTNQKIAAVVYGAASAQ